MRPAGPVTPLSLATGKAYRLHDVGKVTLETQSRLEQLGMRSQADTAIIPGGRTLSSVSTVASGVDSTLILGECIDAIAAKWQQILEEREGDGRNIGAQVEAITERAMRGELDFEKSLRARVELLKGFPVEALAEVYEEHVKLSPGAREMLSAFKSARARFGVISGGFTFFTHRLSETLKLDFSVANVLDVGPDGCLTGKLKSTIVDPAEKAGVLQREHRGGKLSVALGNGFNDEDMLKAAAVAITYHAKPGLADAVRAAGGTVHRIDHCGLDLVPHFFVPEGK
ncbi:phosphoserine phosphatase SerB [Trinickia sp. LjRoot230]|uniref:phosphoserine phosphatase SerB n=1 Tax=Trinickia sp. LjRoot230 TaxID=3342288 RepID=UPI003ECCD9EB